TGVQTCALPILLFNTPPTSRFAAVGAGLAPPAPRASPKICHSERSEESLCLIERFLLDELHRSQRPPPCSVAPASSRLCLGVRRLDPALSALCRGGACPARPSPITPNPALRAEQADFLFRVCSCKSVGLRSEESLFCLLPTHSSLATALQTPCPAAAARAALCRCRGGACPARPSRITPNLSFRAQRGISLVSRHSPLATALSSVAKAALVFRSAGFPPPLECGGWTPLSPRFVGAGLAPPAPRASPKICHSEPSQESWPVVYPARSLGALQYPGFVL